MKRKLTKEKLAILVNKRFTRIANYLKKLNNTKKIKELVIPSSVEFIEKYAFDGWSGRQKIILDWPSTEYKKLEGLKGIDAKVYYNDGKRYKYKK